jgi:hypothetical protein
MMNNSGRGRKLLCSVLRYRYSSLYANSKILCGFVEEEGEGEGKIMFDIYNSILCGIFGTQLLHKLSNTCTILTNKGTNENNEEP